MPPSSANLFGTTLALGKILEFASSTAWAPRVGFSRSSCGSSLPRRGRAMLTAFSFVRRTPLRDHLLPPDRHLHSLLRRTSQQTSLFSRTSHRSSSARASCSLRPRTISSRPTSPSAYIVDSAFGELWETFRLGRRYFLGVRPRLLLPLPRNADMGRSGTIFQPSRGMPKHFLRHARASESRK